VRSLGIGPMSKAGVSRIWAQHALQFAKTSIVGGLIFMVPLVILVVVGAKAEGLVRRLARPLDEWLPMHTIWGVAVADTVAIVAVVLACFLGGMLARVSFADRFVKKAESGVLWRIPGYSFIKALTDSLDGHAHESSMRPVLVHFDDYSQLAFEIDRLADGRRVIYIPSAPDPRAGAVLLMDAERVEAVAMTFVGATRSLRALGRGMGAALSPQPQS
jgi:uncharacterized membrane protein